MSVTEETESRIQFLEEKLAWLEHLVQTLDGVVREQADAMGRLQKEIGLMKEREEARDRASLEAGAPVYEPPPHY